MLNTNIFQSECFSFKKSFWRVVLCLRSNEALVDKPTLQVVDESIYLFLVDITYEFVNIKLFNHHI